LSAHPPSDKRLRLRRRTSEYQCEAEEFAYDVSFVYPADAEPYISNSGDLTKEKIAKLVKMAMDHT
jgi:hypothetical protein